jgi:hypothetical protein
MMASATNGWFVTGSSSMVDGIYGQESRFDSANEDTPRRGGAKKTGYGSDNAAHSERAQS